MVTTKILETTYEREYRIDIIEKTTKSKKMNLGLVLPLKNFKSATGLIVKEVFEKWVLKIV